MSHRSAWLAMLAATGLVTACNGGGGDDTGGGGGGGATAPPINSGGPWVSYTPPTAPPGTSSETLGMGGLVMVNALSAYGDGLTGAGQTVAVVDTGIDTDHIEFAGRISGASADRYGRNLNNTSCGSGNSGECAHGTRVAGIAAAALNGQVMHGIAYEATIMALRADTNCATDCRFTDADLAWAITHAVSNGADVINLSLGGGGVPGTTLRNAMLNATNAGVVLVFAAGNAGDASPDYPGAVATDPAFNGRIVIAGSVDSNGDPSAFSNQAGSAAFQYIMAPGENLTTTNNDGAWIAGVNGTSYAVPLVAGAIALLMDQGLTADQALDRILATAADIGPAGTDTIAGRGIMDLAAALAPAGTTALTGPSGATIPFDTTTLAVSSVMNGASIAEALGGVVVVDALDRFYRADASQAVGAIASAPTAAAYGATIHQQHGVAIADGQVVEFGYSDTAIAPSAGIAGTDGLEWLRMTATGPGGSLVTLSANDGGLLSWRGGVVGPDEAPVEVFRPPVPHALLVGNPVAAELVVPLGTDGWIGSYAATSLDSVAEEPWMTADDTARATVIGVDAGRRLDPSTRIAVGFGVLMERDAVLGTTGEGAFADLGQAMTGFAGAALSHQIGAGVTLDLALSAGMTDVTGDGGALGGFDDLVSMEARAGLTMNGLVAEGDRFGLGVARPLSLSGGSAEVRLATGVSASGAAIVSAERVSLTPQSEPVEATVYYAVPVGDGSLRFDGIVAHDDFGTEGYAGLRYHLPLD